MVSACVTITEGPPALIPEGWIHDYDYKTSLRRYLRDQYNSAAVEGARAYVYIYSDLDRHCIGTRRMISRPEVAPVLSAVRITMLNFGRLKRLYAEEPDSAFDPGDKVPVFAKISMDGNLTKAVFYPDIALYYKPRRDKTRYEIWNQPQTRWAADFAGDLKNFFDSNNEI